MSEKTEFEKAILAFNSGNLVRLKSGGPIMTVSRAVDGQTSSATGREIGVHCDWHDRENRPQHAVYSPDQLVKA